MARQIKTRRPATNSAPPDVVSRHRPARALLLLLLITVLGLSLRVGLLQTAPRHAYFHDHLDFMVWAEWARRFGPTALYDLSPDMPINAQLPAFISPEPTVAPYPNPNRCNYPPLSGYLLWLQGGLWHALGTPAETHAMTPAVADYLGIQGGQLASPVINTFRARLVNALLPTLADLMMAIGVVLLAHTVQSRAPRWTTPVTFGLVFLAPPIMLNSAFWTQWDALLAAPLVWTMYFLVRERHLGAGACYGAALMIKPQAILLLPVLLFVFLALAGRADGSWQRARRMWRMPAAALGVVAVLAAPYMWADRGHPQRGSLRWFYRSYELPIQKQYPATTLKAFNVWWLQHISSGHDASSLDPNAPAAGGLTKQQFGWFLLVAALGASGVLCMWRWSWEPPGWLAFAFLTLFAAFLFPTRVHERYIFYCVPFAVAATLVFRPWHPILLALFLVGGFEMTWNLWLVSPLEGPLGIAGSMDALIGSTALAALSVLTFAYALVALVPWGRLLARHEHVSRVT